MISKEKNLIIIIFLSVVTFYLYASETVWRSGGIWVYVLLFPVLLAVCYYMYRAVQENSLYNAGGNINIINYYGLNPVFLQIIEDNKFFAWDDYVDESSITQYEWAGQHEIRAVASDDPNIGNPSTTIYFDLTYNVSGNDTIIIVLNADGSVFEQMNAL